MGIFGGLGFMSKYIIVIFFLGFIFWLLLDLKNRFILWSFNLWIGGLLALIINSFLIYTDFQNNWTSFSFIFNKGINTEWSLGNIFSFQLGHLFFYSIFLSLPAWYLVIKKKFINQKYKKFSHFCFK